MRFYYHCLHLNDHTLQINSEYFQILKGKQLSLSIISPSHKFKEIYSLLDDLDIIVKDSIESKDLTEYEHPILSLLSRDLCTYHDDEIICYLHGKGTAADNRMNRNWRRYLISQMEGYVIGKAPFREDFMAAGCLWMNDIVNKRSYFAGNHWFSKVKWLKQLPRYDDFISSWNRWRYCAEFWINAENNLQPLVLDNKAYIFPDTFEEFKSFIFNLNDSPK